MPKFRTAYCKSTAKPDMFLDEHGEPRQSMTEQHHHDAVEINSLIKRHDGHDLITHVTTSTARYGDYSEINEYEMWANKVAQANAAFMELPSGIRKKFGHDPGAFFEFASNPENLREMVKMGLAKEVDGSDAPSTVVKSPESKKTEKSSKSAADEKSSVKAD